MDAGAREAAGKPYFDRQIRVTDHQPDGISRLFPDRGGFHSMGKETEYPRRAGPGFRGGIGGGGALSITDLDPLRFGLLFERFLNPERVSMPDFDIDFCQDRRER